MDPTQNPVGPTNDDSHVPLGRLLVDAGLLAAEDLDRALAEQLATGKPLGRVLVDSGYVPPSSVAMALADQHGGLLKTEYGYATGRRPAERDAEPLRLVTGGAQQAVAPEPEAAQLGDRLRAEEAKRAELAAAELAELRSQLALSQSELAQAVAERDALRGQLTATEAEQAQACAERDTLRADLQAAEARFAEAGSAFAELRAQARAGAERIVELEALVAGLQQPAPPPPPAEHALFVPLPEGYVVREVAGPPPAAGAVVEVDGHAFRVLRTGPAPFPGAEGVCAFLEPR